MDAGKDISLGLTGTSSALPILGQQSATITYSGQATTTPSALPSFGAATATSATPPPLSLGPITASAPSFVAQQPAVRLQPATTLSFGSTTAPSTGFSFGALTSTADVAKVAPSVAPATTTSPTTSTRPPRLFLLLRHSVLALLLHQLLQQPQLQLHRSITSTSATPTSATTIPVAEAALNFRFLEEPINKWLVDLGGKEKTSFNQAISVVPWDRSLVLNGEKIVALKDSVNGVKIISKKIFMLPLLVVA